MDEYKLRSDESVLFKCDTFDNTKILLTNLNLVIIKESKKFKKRKKDLSLEDQTPVNIYPVEDVKIYKDVPQIKLNNNTVEIYLTSTEITIEFCSRVDAYKFTNTAIELLTGKNSFTRGAEKFKSAIDTVDDTLGINTVGTVKNVVENGVTGCLLGFIGKKATGFSKKPSGGQMALNATKQLLNSKSSDCETSTSDEFNNNIEKLEKFKKLLDAGIITKEEYEQKKLELLNSI